jgi:hypothetical protein
MLLTDYPMLVRYQKEHLISPKYQTLNTCENQILIVHGLIFGFSIISHVKIGIEIRILSIH